ncbi:MAG: hypothetical protein V4584_09205 [Verrucomicrobiota bacterium]
MNTLHHYLRPGKIPALLLGSLVLTSAAALADDTSKFEAADADSSGSLTLAEFRTTLSRNAPEKQLLKKFGRADADGDTAVTLAEWLAYKQELEEEQEQEKIEKETARFNAADDDVADGFLTYDEFIPLIPGKRPLIEVRSRFLKADADDDLLVSLDEWLAFKSDDFIDDSKKPRKFDLADLSGDGLLTYDEFATTFPRKTPSKTILKKFNKEDENNDDLLTRGEWSPGQGKGKDKGKSDPA